MSDKEGSPRIYMSPPHMTDEDRRLLLDAFDSNWVAPLGPHVDAFEREFADYVGVPHAVALSSGTAALHLGLLLLGVEPGDTVVTSTMTFVATANAIRYVGANPVFVDSEWSSWNLDPELLADELHAAAASGQLPRCVLPVDMNGQCCNYDAIQEICSRYDVPILEDAAEALGATYRGKPAGSLGTIGCFSFNGNKIITTSGGGMLVTCEEPQARQARFLATQARDPAPHYEHSQMGFNYRLSNLLAAVGRGQLRVLDQRVARRRAIFAEYARRLGGLPGVTLMPEPADSKASRWLTAVLIDPEQFGADREAVRQALEQQNIESRPIWKPMHQQPAYSRFRCRGGSVADRLFQQGLCLPSGSSLTDDDLDRIIGICESLRQ